MILGNEKTSRSPTGLRVAPKSYAALEQIAKDLRPLLPTSVGSSGYRLDSAKILESTLPQAGYYFRCSAVSDLQDCAAFTIPDHGLVVLREDVYDQLNAEQAFARSTVVHELSHIVLRHAATLHRDAKIGEHRFCEDSEWQAKALTAALMMPIEACKAASSATDLAQICGTSYQAASYRLERLIKTGQIPAKPSVFDLFNQK